MKMQVKKQMGKEIGCVPMLVDEKDFQDLGTYFMYKNNNVNFITKFNFIPAYKHAIFFNNKTILFLLTMHDVQKYDSGLY